MFEKTLLLHEAHCPQPSAELRHVLLKSGTLVSPEDVQLPVLPLLQSSQLCLHVPV